jgi:transcriptional regulator with XRE-family HTH domain
MKNKHINKSELSRQLNKSRQYISKILNENTNFTIKSIAEICIVLDIDLIFDIPENYLKCKVYFKPKPIDSQECKNITNTDYLSSKKSNMKKPIIRNKLLAA